MNVGLLFGGFVPTLNGHFSQKRIWVPAVFCLSFEGGHSRHGQHAAEIQRQGSLLQSGALSFLRGHAQCQSESG